MALSLLPVLLAVGLTSSAAATPIPLGDITGNPPTVAHLADQAFVNDLIRRHPGAVVLALRAGFPRDADLMPVLLAEVDRTAREARYIIPGSDLTAVERVELKNAQHVNSPSSVWLWSIALTGLVMIPVFRTMAVRRRARKAKKKAQI